MRTFFFEAFLLVLVTLLTRSLPRFILPLAVSSDGYYHLLAAKRIRENGFFLPRRLKGLCFPSPYDYPPLFHYFISIFPISYHKFIEQYSSPVFDSILVVTFYITTGIVHENAKMGISPFSLSWLFLFSPALMQVGLGPRSFGLTPRIFSEVLFSVGTITWCWGYVREMPLVWVITIFCVVGVLLSSKFGFQVYLFCYPIIGIVLGTWHPIWILVAGVVLAILVSRGHYLAILIGHIGHIRLHSELRSRRPEGYANYDVWPRLVEAVRKIISHPRKGLYHLVCINSISAGVLRNPQVIFSVIVLFCPMRTFGIWEKVLLAWMAGCVFPFLLTSLNRFGAMGEADRYISYAVFPSFLLLGFVFQIPVKWDVAFNSILVWNIFLSILYIVVFFLLYGEGATHRKESGEIMQFLGSLGKDTRILPINAAPYSLAYYSGQDVFYPSGNYAVHFIHPDEFEWLYKDTVHIRVDRTVEIAEKYGLNTILIRKIFTSLEDFQTIINRPEWEMLKEDSQYWVGRYLPRTGK